MDERVIKSAPSSDAKSATHCAVLSDALVDLVLVHRLASSGLRLRVKVAGIGGRMLRQ